MAVAGLARNRRDGALGVVGGQEIHRTVQRRGRVVLADLHQSVSHGGDVRAVQVIQRGAAERVVHHSVQTVPAQVGAAAAKGLLRRRIFPHFAQQQLVLAVGFDGSTNFFNKIVGQLVGYVQPEAGRAQIQPGVDDAALAADKFHVGG